MEAVLTALDKGETEEARKALKKMGEKVLSEEEKPQVLYLEALSALKEGDYAGARERIWRITGEFYDARLHAFGESDKLRVLGAEMIATEAANRGLPEDVLWLEDMLGGDARLDWCTLHDVSGKAAGKAKLADLLAFQKIRALVRAERFDEAREALGMAFLLRGSARTEDGVVDISREISILEEELHDS